MGVPFPFASQCGNHISERQQTLVDIDSLLHRCTSGSGFFGPFTSGQINEVKFCYHELIRTGCFIPYAFSKQIRNEMLLNSYRENAMRPGRLLVHQCRSNTTLIAAQI